MRKCSRFRWCEVISVRRRVEQLAPQRAGPVRPLPVALHALPNLLEPCSSVSRPGVILASTHSSGLTRLRCSRLEQELRQASALLRIRQPLLRDQDTSGRPVDKFRMSVHTAILRLTWAMTIRSAHPVSTPVLSKEPSETSTRSSLVYFKKASRIPSLGSIALRRRIHPHSGCASSARVKSPVPDAILD